MTATSHFAWPTTAGGLRRAFRAARLNASRAPTPVEPGRAPASAFAWSPRTPRATPPRRGAARGGAIGAAIARAHDGTAEAGRGPSGGAEVRIELPVPGRD